MRADLILRQLGAGQKRLLDDGLAQRLIGEVGAGEVLLMRSGILNCLGRQFLYT